MNYIKNPQIEAALQNLINAQLEYFEVVKAEQIKCQHLLWVTVEHRPYVEYARPEFYQKCGMCGLIKENQ